MIFRIADTFTDSLSRLTADEQKAVKMSAFDLQVNPANPGIQLHRVDRTKDKRFWSARVSRDLRIIVHRSESSFLLCFTAHHDAAYAWAERRKLETHPTTGAAQIVEIRETVREVRVPVYVEETAVVPPQAPLFAHVPDAELLAYGVPADWLGAVREATEETILEVAARLPGEAAEALLELATGRRPEAAKAAEMAPADPFEHPDARRRFRVMENVQDLERALAYPWDKWALFLHPLQRDTVERAYSGPVRVSGTAGTGKTIVALHRAVFLARTHPDARVLLTTFSEPLARALKGKLRRLVSNEPRLGERIDVESLAAVGRRLHDRNLGKSRLAPAEKVRTWLREAASERDTGVSEAFLWAEWADVVDAWQIGDWESYRDVKRLGRKTRLAEAKRRQLWDIFAQVRERIERGNLQTEATMFTALATLFAERKTAPYDFVIVDEAQDVSVAQLRFLGAMAGSRPDGLFFTGDLGQRIFQTPFSWKSLGVDIRGRSRILRVNYRTSHQIRGQADRLLDPEIADVDGNVESRAGTVSVFNGPPPQVSVSESEEKEIEAVAKWLDERVSEGYAPNEIGVFVRSAKEEARAVTAVTKAGLTPEVLTENFHTHAGRVAVSTMHLAKGLEFRAVVVMACDDEVIPSQERIETIGDTADLEEVYATERHLLYVACTRARDCLLLSATAPESEFLGDLEVRPRKV